MGFIRGHLGQPIASTAAIAPMSRDFVARLRAFADAHAIPCIDFARGQRKDEVMHEHLVHCVDEDFGAFFLKFSSNFPYGARLLVNGHHYAQARAAKAGIGFTALDNGFAACDDVAPASLPPP